MHHLHALVLQRSNGMLHQMLMLHTPAGSLQPDPCDHVQLSSLWVEVQVQEVLQM